MRDRLPERSWTIALRGLLGIAAALLVFGDYLFLSVSRLWVGSPGNWILLAGIVQVGALLVAFLLGRLRGSTIDAALIGFLGMGVVMLLHLLDQFLSGSRVEGYAVQKIAAWFGICGPALWLGRALMRGGSVEGGRWVPWMVAPLLVMCGVAVVTDPSLLTVEHHLDMGVYLGLLVLPAHQALAFSLAKTCLLVLAVAQGPDSGRGLRLLAWVGGGLVLGLVCLSGARTYALALVVALAVQWIFGRKRVLPTLVGIAACAALVVGLSSQVLASRFDPTQLRESLSYLERLGAWRNAWHAFVEQPLLGHGPGGFATVYSSEARVYPHNLALEVGSEFGFVGLCCLLLIVGPAALALVRGLRSRTPLSVAQLFAFGFFVFALIGTMSVGDLIRNHFLFLACGMAAGSVRAPDRTRLRSERAPRLALAGAPS